MSDRRRRGALGAVVIMVGLVVLLFVTQDNDGLIGLFGSADPAERAEQVLAGIKAESPYVAQLEQTRPDVIAELRAVLTRDAAAELPVQRMADNGRAVLAEWFTGAIAAAPDSVAIELMAVTTDQLRELLDANPAICAAMITGRAFGDIDPHISDGVRQREREALSLLASSPADGPVVTLPQIEIDAAYQAINPGLEARFGADMALMSMADAADRDPSRVCEIQIAILEAIAVMDAARAAAMARALLGGG